MSDLPYKKLIDESSATLNRILGKNGLEESQGPQGSQGSQGSDSEGSNINDLTNLFHFLLLDDKHTVNQKIRDKLTKVYQIFRSTPPVPQQPPQPVPQQPQSN